MMAVDLPLDSKSMVRGLDYFVPEKPKSDAATGIDRRDNTTKPDLPQGRPSRCEIRSLPSLVGTPDGARSDRGTGGVQSGVLQTYDPKTGTYRKVGR